jgi:hypothetical protein
VIVAAVTLLLRVPFAPLVPAVEADQVEKYGIGVVPDWPVNVWLLELVLVRAEAAFHVAAVRVDVASDAPVVPGSAVFNCRNPRTAVGVFTPSSAWLAAVMENPGMGQPFFPARFTAAL